MSTFVRRAATTALPSSGPHPRRLVAGPVGGAVGLMLAAGVGVGVVLEPVAAGPAMLMAGLVVVVVVLAWTEPAAALVLLVVTAFLRPALHGVALPVPVPLVLVVVALAGLGASVASGALRAPKIGALEVTMGLYVTANAVSAVAPHPLAAPEADSVALLVATGTALPFGMFVVGRAAGASDRLVRVLLWTVVGVTAYSALLGFLQFHGPRSLVWPRYVIDAPSWSDRAVGVFNQPVTNGVLLLVGGAVALHLARTTRSRRLRVLALTVVVAAAYATYLTHTRAVWLAALVVLVLATTVREARRSALAVLGAVAVLVATHWDTLLAADRAVGGVGSTSEVDDRLNMVATAWWAIGQRPWFGWGVGRFPTVNLYFHRQWAPDVDWRRGFGIASHENELGIAAELGVIGLALWVAVVALLVRRVGALVRHRPPGPQRHHALVAAAAVVVLVVVGATVDLRFLDFAEDVVFLLAGLAVGRAAVTP